MKKQKKKKVVRSNYVAQINTPEIMNYEENITKLDVEISRISELLSYMKGRK